MFSLSLVTFGGSCFPLPSHGNAGKAPQVSVMVSYCVHGNLLLAKVIQRLSSHKGNQHWNQTDLHPNPEPVVY